MKSYKELNEELSKKIKPSVQQINEELAELTSEPMPQDYMYNSTERKSIFDQLNVTEGTRKAIVDLIKSFGEEGDLYLGAPYLRKNDFGLVLQFRKEDTNNIIVSANEFWAVAESIGDRLRYVSMKYESLIIGIRNS